MLPPRIALATCARLPETDPDEALLLDALRGAGADAFMLAWDGTAGEGGARERPDLVVLRSTWNYAQAPERFLEWLGETEKRTRVLNAPSLVRWNIDKGYLADLSRRGVAIVPTEFCRRGDARSLAEIRRSRGFGDVVVKPQISAGSYRTSRVGADDESLGEEVFRMLVSERDTLVQP